MDPVFWEGGGFREGCVWAMISAGLGLRVYGGRGCRSRSESQRVGREELTSWVGWWPDLSWSWSESRIVWPQTSAQGTLGSFWVSPTEPWPTSVSAGKRWRRLEFKVKFLCFFKFFQGLGNKGLLINFTSSSGFPLCSQPGSYSVEAMQARLQGGTSHTSPNGLSSLGPLWFFGGLGPGLDLPLLLLCSSDSI